MGEFLGDDGDNYLEGTEEKDVIRGGAGHDIIEGYGGDDELFGDGGDDAIYGGDGHDVIDGGNGHDYIDSGAGDDVVYGRKGDDVIGTLDGDDIIFGGDGDDRIDDGYGNDYIDGGDGFDILYVRNSIGATVNLQTGLSFGQGVDTIVSIDGVSGSFYDDTLIGDDLGNYFYGGFNGHDRFFAHGGDDFFVISDGWHEYEGGEGSDTLSLKEVFKFYSPGATGAHFDLAAAEATDGYYGFAVGSAIDISGVENVEGGLTNDTIKGNGDDNILAGRAGDDVLHGQGGGDTLIGDGRLLYNITQRTTQIDYAELEDDGDDTLLGGDGNDFIYGLGGNDILEGGGDHDNLFGGSGDDWLVGGDGLDNIDGGLGNDTASWADSSGWVSVQLQSGVTSGYAEGDILTSIENLEGSAFNDVLYGSFEVNMIWGGAGDDVIYGGGNSDQLFGEEGDDLFYMVGSDVLVDGGEGFDIAHFGFTFLEGLIVDLSVATQDFSSTPSLGDQIFVSIEGVIGTEYSDTILGNGEANLLFGFYENGSGANDDIIKGFGGDDLILVGEGNHVVVGGGGSDMLELASYLDDTNGTLGFTFSLALQGTTQDTGRGAMTVTGIENLTGSRENDILIGDGAANVMSGNMGQDWVLGGAGDDTLHGDAQNDVNDEGWYLTTFGVPWGDDVLDGEEGDDTVYGNGGNDVLIGGDGNDALYGQDDNDTLRGDAGGDVLDGGYGYDVLKGGSGKDDMSGGGEDDILRGNGGDDHGDGGDGNDQVFGGGGADTLEGGEGDDVVSGGGAGDTLFGDNGEDQLFGDGGNDWIDGGRGHDQLTGGAGNDIFYFDDVDGEDTILDMEAGDTIAFDAAMDLMFEDLVISVDGDSAFIHWNTGDSIAVFGEAATSLSEANFWFGASDPQATMAVAKEAQGALADLQELSFGGYEAKWGGEALDAMMVDAGAPFAG